MKITLNEQDIKTILKAFVQETFGTSFVWDEFKTNTYMPTATFVQVVIEEAQDDSAQ
jgi:hypothetical protein